MRKTVKDMFLEIKDMNKQNGWLNAKLDPINNSKCVGYFNISLKSFKTIQDGINVGIYAITNYGDGFTIHCKSIND
jgi:hypothetical protein